MTDVTMTAGLAAGLVVVATKAIEVSLAAIRSRNGKAAVDSGSAAASFDPKQCREHGEDIARLETAVGGMADTIRESLTRIDRRLDGIEAFVRSSPTRKT